MSGWNDFLYGTFGAHTGEYANKDYYDFYGNKVQRSMATNLTPAGNEAYKAQAQQIANQFAEAKKNSLGTAQAMGLSKSGANLATQNALNVGEAQTKSAAYATYMQNEQSYLDSIYTQNKALASQLEFMKRSEAMARQGAWISLLGNIMATGTQIATKAAFAASGVPA